MRHLSDLRCLLAKQVLSQLSYTPTKGVPFILKHLPRFQNPFLRIFIEWSEPLELRHFCIRQLARKALKSGSKKEQGYTTEFRHERQVNE